MENAQTQISTTKTQNLIVKTLGCCSTCFKTIPAEIVERNGKVFMLKECCEKEDVLLENDVSFYKRENMIEYYERSFLELAKNRYAGRVWEGFITQSPALLITVTLKCNLDCPICLNTKFPSQVNHQTDVKMPLETIRNMVSRHKGKTITIWGGEPTLREDLPEIIQTVERSGNTSSVCTNGLKLLDKKYCEVLQNAGLTFLDLQFDGFRDDVYLKMRGMPLLEKKMEILKNLKDLKMKTNLMAVIGRGINEEQITLLIKFASMNTDFIHSVQLIELYTGNLGEEERITHSDILKIIESGVGVPAVELFVQTKRLYKNLGRLVRNVTENELPVKAAAFSHSSTMYLRKTKDGFQPYLNIQWLKKTNEIIEEAISKSRIACVFHLVKNAKHFLNKEFIKVAMPVVLNGFDVFKGGAAMSAPDIVKVGLCSIKSPMNEDLERSCYKEDLVTDPIITNFVGVL